MKNILFVFSLLSYALCVAQDFSYPTLKSNGRSISNFIPNGWKVLKSASGDLNNDKLKDMAFVLQLKDNATFIKHKDYYEPDYNDTIITQPRILVIAFYNPITKQYNLVEQNNSFILTNDDPTMEEPFESISILKGVLNINFNIFYNAGSWTMAHYTYKFRYQDKEFKLIGSDYNSYNRGSGETDDRSFNFLTKKVKVVTGNSALNKKEKIIWRSFELNELKTFKTFTQPLTWEVEQYFEI